MKNLDELKAFLLEHNQNTIKNDYTTPEGMDKQFKNKISNNALILYAVKNGDGFSVYKFYCDKNGNAITKETFENEKVSTQ